MPETTITMNVVNEPPSRASNGRTSITPPIMPLVIPTTTVPPLIVIFYLIYILKSIQKYSVVFFFMFRKTKRAQSVQERKASPPPKQGKRQHSAHKLTAVLLNQQVPREINDIGLSQSVGPKWVTKRMKIVRKKDKENQEVKKNVQQVNDFEAFFVFQGIEEQKKKQIAIANLVNKDFDNLAQSGLVQLSGEKIILSQKFFKEIISNYTSQIYLLKERIQISKKKKEKLEFIEKQIRNFRDECSQFFPAYKYEEKTKTCHILTLAINHLKKNEESLRKLFTQKTLASQKCAQFEKNVQQRQKLMSEKDKLIEFMNEQNEMLKKRTIQRVQVELDDEDDDIITKKKMIEQHEYKVQEVLQMLTNTFLHNSKLKTKEVKEKVEGILGVNLWQLISQSISSQKLLIKYSKGLRTKMVYSIKNYESKLRHSENLNSRFTENSQVIYQELEKIHEMKKRIWKILPQVQIYITPNQTDNISHSLQIQFENLIKQLISKIEKIKINYQRLLF